MESKSPVVSVIIPCYTYGRFLPETLSSILAQSFKEWECILVANGSDQLTREEIRRHAGMDKRFRVLSVDNRGPAAARNAGAGVAKGRYIQFLDADDLLEPDKLGVQSDFLEAHPEIGLVYGEVRYFTHGAPRALRRSLNPPDREWMPKVSGTGRRLIDALLRYNIMTMHAPLLRKGLLDQVGGMDESLRGFEDWDLWMRMALTGAEFAFHPAPGSLALVRTHPGSLNQDQNTMRRYLLRVWEKALESGRLGIGQRLFVWARMEEEFAAMTWAGRSGQAMLSGSTRLRLRLGMPLFFPLMKLARFFRHSN